MLLKGGEYANSAVHHFMDYNHLLCRLVRWNHHNFCPLVHREDTMRGMHEEGKLKGGEKMWKKVISLLFITIWFAILAWLISPVYREGQLNANPTSRQERQLDEIIYWLKQIERNTENE